MILGQNLGNWNKKIVGAINEKERRGSEKTRTEKTGSESSASHK